MAKIGKMNDIRNLFKETFAEFMENSLEAGLDEEPGYGKYPYKNKDTDNSGSTTTAYAYGLERIAAYNKNGVTRYVYNGRGSVAQAVNAPVAGEAVSSPLPDVGV